MFDNSISVCLLVYNHAHTLENTISSILNQSFKNYEFIISDDNSSDTSFEIAINYSKKDKRIIPVKTPKNLGMAGNANFALSYAKNNLVALLHHDDILRNDCLQSWVSLAGNEDKIGFVFNDYLWKDTFSKKNVRMKNSFKSVMNGKDFLVKILLKYWSSPVRGTALINKEFYDEIGGMKEKFGMLADIDLWMRLSAKWDVGFVNDPLIEVINIKPINYPKDYKEFSWDRKFILFDIHSSNINRVNFPIYLYYLIKRLVFRNKLSIEIIKWFLYALIRSKKEIIKSYPKGGYHLELFYVKIFRSSLTKMYK